MSIPHCFDHLLGAKPKHPQVGALVAPHPVDEIAPLSQIPGLNLTQFNNIGNFNGHKCYYCPLNENSRHLHQKLMPAFLNTHIKWWDDIAQN